jgi:hypothetical protein
LRHADYNIVAAEILQNDLCSGVPQESRSAEIVRDMGIIAAFTFPFIILRLISRVWVTKRVWWDDWAVIFAAASTSLPVKTKAGGITD